MDKEKETLEKKNRSWSQVASSGTNAPPAPAPPNGRWSPKASVVMNNIKDYTDKKDFNGKDRAVKMRQTHQVQNSEEKG